MADPLLCPECGRRDADTPSGLCSVCVVERLAENYAAQDRRLVQDRRSRWGERAGNRFMSLRQQRRRLIREIRPRRPDPGGDPWAIALEALEALKQIRGRETVSRPALEDIAEAIRRLAWGPDESPQEGRGAD